MNQLHSESRSNVRDSQTTSMRAAWAATFDDLDLAALGWAHAVRSAPSAVLTDHPTALPARVVRVDRGRVLLVATGDGTLRHVRDRTDAETPSAVGDWVLVDPPALGADGYGFARVRLPRSGVLARRDATASTTPQVLAANVDLVLVTEALAPDREINFARIARFAALAAAGDAQVRVLLTGADRIGDVMFPTEVSGITATATSIIDGRGIDAVRDLLAPGTTATLVGASGSGKSSLANALLEAETFAVGARRGSGTGRHTTSAARLVPIPRGGLLVDTPGIRDVGMHGGVDAASLTPPSINNLVASCRFRDCGHDGEPGCAIDEAIERGELSAEDVVSWRKLEREALREQARSDDRLRRELKAENVSRAKGYVKARRRGAYDKGR